MKRLIGVVVLLVVMAILVGCSGSDDASTGAVGEVREVGGMKIEDVVIGTGTEASAGKTIVVNYTGKLEDGTVFDSSIPRGEPFTFVLGAGQVIEGWDKGFDGMKVGGERILTIPAEMGYGAMDMGAIPPNSTLIFDVELVDVL